MLATAPAVIAGIKEILADEREHLRRFSEMKEEYPVTVEEEKLLISSMAAEVLFTGGVMEMKREQALTTLIGLYRYAAESEAGAVETYGNFASKCQDAKVHDTFMAIVREESEHLTVLLDKLEKMDK
jgi:rubrerythrin